MRSLALLIKPVSGNCNLRCKYCFYSDVTDNREIKNLGVMSKETLETIVKKALSEAEEFCAFGFQGGEPTLAGIDFYKSLIEFEKVYNTKNIKIMHTIQTNGILIDEEWASFLAENNFLTGLSIDAGKQIHDDLRIDGNRKGSHSKALKAARLLTKAEAQFNILTVVTKPLARHPDNTYQFYKRQGFRHVQFIPCIDGLDESKGSHPYSLDADTYGKFLCRIFDLWYADLMEGHYSSIRAFDNYIYMLKGYPPENCAMNGTCQAYALIEADGGVYPCDFYAVDQFVLGNIAANRFDEMLGSEKAKEFIAPSTYKDLSCLQCEYYSICRGGCRRDREPVSNGHLSLNHYCEAYKMFFKHCLPRMEAVARHT